MMTLEIILLRGLFLHQYQKGKVGDHVNSGDIERG